MLRVTSHAIPPRHPRKRRGLHTIVLTALLSINIGIGLTGCGGTDPTSDPSAEHFAASRAEAAKATAESATNQCSDIHPFYWEVGDKDAPLLSGSVGGATYTADTVVPIASASKWLYASYVVEKQAGGLSPTDVKFLTFNSGYTNFNGCLADQTIGECLNSNGNQTIYNASADGRFFYHNGHMQQHASLTGLGAANANTLASAIMSELGTDLGLSYSTPQPAVGGVTSARGYARFLRRLLGDQFHMSTRLGTHAVCTNPATCPTASFTILPSPAPSWHYSLGHWVENEPSTGDGAFSSIGSGGFYPWIDATHTYYGIVVRNTSSNTWFESAKCGRLIRKAWATGVAQ